MQSLQNRDLQDWIGGDADDTPESDSHAIEDGEADSAPESEDTPESDSHAKEDGETDSAPESDSHVKEDGEADSAPEVDDPHTTEGGEADNAPKSEDSYHTETTETEGTSATTAEEMTFLRDADTDCEAAMEVVVDGMRAVEENYKSVNSHLKEFDKELRHFRESLDREMGNGVPVMTEVDTATGKSRASGYDNPVVEAPKAADEAQSGTDAIDTGRDGLAEDTKGTGPAAKVAATAADMKSEMVPDDRMETVALCAGHRGEGLTFDELEGLRRLRVALMEQRGCMRAAWDEVMVSVENGLVFTELETLMVVARDAVNRVIKTSERLIEETRAPDARVVKTQPIGQLMPGQDKHGRQFAQEGQSLTEARAGQMPPYRGTPAPSQRTQAIKIMPLDDHGGVPFEVDVWRDVDCTRSLISADWAAAFGVVIDAYPYTTQVPPGYPRFSSSPVIMGAYGDVLDRDGLVTFTAEFRGKSTSVSAWVTLLFHGEVMLGHWELVELGLAIHQEILP